MVYKPGIYRDPHYYKNLKYFLVDYYSKVLNPGEYIYFIVQNGGMCNWVSTPMQGLDYVGPFSDEDKLVISEFLIQSNIFVNK